MPERFTISVVVLLLVLLPSLRSRAAPAGRDGSDVAFTDATEASGLPLANAARLTFADLNADGRPDVVVRATAPGATHQACRIFLNEADASSPIGFRFTEVASHGIPAPAPADVLTFADLDNDGLADAILARYLDVNNPKFVAPTTAPTTTAWL